MKGFRIIIAVFVTLVLLLLAGGFVFLKTLDVNKFLPQITQEASKAIGRQLLVGSAAFDLSFGKGLVLEARDITIADDPRFSNKIFLKAGRIEVGVNVAAFIFQRKVHIGHIVIVSPDIVIVRSREGIINALTFAVPAPAQAVTAPSAPAPAVAALPLLVVQEISVTDAHVTYIDEMFSPRLELTAGNIDINIQDFSLTGPFTVKVLAALLSADQDMKARLTLSLVSPEAVLSSLNGEVNVEAKNGVLEHVNLIVLALGNIPMLPGVLDSVMPELSAETQQEVRQGITRIESCKAAARIVNGVIEIDSADIVTRELDLHAKGWLKLVEDMDVKADIRLSSALSTRLGEKVRELSSLKDDQGRIYLPVGIKGPVIKPKVTPDAEYLARKLVEAISGGRLEKLLGGDAKATETVGAIFDMFRKK